MTHFTRSNTPSGFYVYAYLREDTTPYYIGKGKGVRAWHHNGRSDIKPPTDKTRIVVLWHDLDEEFALEMEVLLIATYGRKDNGTGILRNGTDGGDGVSGRDPWNKGLTGIDINNPWKGVTGRWSEDALEANRLANSGENHPNWGKTLADIVGEERAQQLSLDIAVRMTAQVVTDETRAKLSQNNPMSDAQIVAKISGHNAYNADATLYRWQNIETGNEFVMTRIDFCSAFDALKGNVLKHMKGLAKSVRGHRLIGYTHDHSIADKRIKDDSTVYCWEHIVTGQRVHMTRQEFIAHTGAHKGNVADIASDKGRRKSVAGYRCVTQ